MSKSAKKRVWDDFGSHLKASKKKARLKVIKSPFKRVPKTLVHKYTPLTLCGVLSSTLLRAHGDCKSAAIALEFLCICAHKSGKNWSTLRTLDTLGPSGGRLRTFLSTSARSTVCDHGAVTQKFCMWLCTTGVTRLEKVVIRHLIGFLEFEAAVVLTINTLMVSPVHLSGCLL